MIYISGFVVLLEFFIFFRALVQWSFGRRLLKRENRLAFGLLEIPIAERRVDDYIETKRATDSLLYKRWVSINDLAENSQASPIDQSFLDDELEARLDHLVGPLRAKTGVAVLVGLAGTLVGLSMGVQNLKNALPPPGRNLDLGKFTSDMGDTLSGFGAAFYSALAGVVAAILVALLAANLQQVCEEFALFFRSFSRTSLLRSLATSEGQLTFAEQLRVLAETLRDVERRLPAENTLEDTIANLTDLNNQLAQSAQRTIDAYERSVHALTESNTITQSIQGLRIVLEEHAQRTEEMIGHALGTIEQATRKQIDMCQEFIRLALDSPMEVAGARLFVSDRPELEKMQRLLESRLDRVEHGIRQTNTKLEKVAGGNGVFKRVFGRWKRAK